MNYKKTIEKNRNGKDQFMKNHPQSPIDDNHIKSKFTHLEYYPIDERWNFKLSLNQYETIDIIEMETSTGSIQSYDRIGYLEFKQPDTNELAKINIYESKSNPGHYFVPFRDKTSGNETYGAGRYLDVEEKNNIFTLDFNQAYNPFCAYSYNYSCPLPPMENWLQIEITTGEKDFPFSH